MTVELVEPDVREGTYQYLSARPISTMLQIKQAAEAGLIKWLDAHRDEIIDVIKTEISVSIEESLQDALESIAGTIPNEIRGACQEWLRTHAKGFLGDSVASETGTPQDVSLSQGKRTRKSLAAAEQRAREIGALK